MNDTARRPVGASIRSKALAALQIVGPGAIIASLTIGTGELIFSSRAGVLFGYSILWVFSLILLFKWALVFALSRHYLLTGVHPIARWMDLPGPRGWLPMILLIAGVFLFPIWIGFHSGVIGTLVGQLVGINSHLAAAAALGAVLTLVVLGNYTLLERCQMLIVFLMVLGVCVSLALLRPDWVSLLVSAIWPTPLAYPDWLAAHPDFESIAERPVWAEVATYVGVIGGSSYDYLAYTAYLREKGWRTTDTPADPRRGLRHCSVDLLVSFLAVMLISAAFVASGHLVLGPNQRIPNDDNMLNLQAEFLTRLSSGLYPLYIAGALLTMVGTLYGTMEVAPVVFREWALAHHGGKGHRLPIVLWCGLGGMGVIAYRYGQSTGRATGLSLVDLISPAALVTGVLACGIICGLNCWLDRRSIAEHRMGPIVFGLNVFACGIFCAVALRGLYVLPKMGPSAWLFMGGILVAGGIAAYFWPARVSPEGEP